MAKRNVKTYPAPNRLRKEEATSWAFAAPAMLLLLFFLIIPFFMAIYFSFTDQRLVPGPNPTSFVGLQNFVRVFLDEIFLRALLNNFLFTIFVVPIQTVFALSLALLINQKIKGVMVFRTIYFSPVVTTLVVIAIIWTFLYSPDQGLINEFLKTISFGQLGPYQWLNDPYLALPAIMIMSIWQGVGFQMIIYLAGLQSIAEELYEAAKIDGAGGWSRFISITIPQLRNTSIFVITATTIMAFRLYAQVQIMTQGGPENATVTTVYYTVIQGFTNLRVGYASAIAVIFFLIVLTISMLQRVFLSEER
jgi:multiple sugar transport system permease protein